MGGELKGAPRPLQAEDTYFFLLGFPFLRENLQEGVPQHGALTKP